MSTFADKIEMQNRLFAELSDMFGREVPLYDKALLVNKACNKTVCSLFGLQHFGGTARQNQRGTAWGDTHRQTVRIPVGGGILCGVRAGAA